MRDLQTVKVRRLQRLLNNVVHEALYQDERMRYYVQEAYEILDDALDKTVGEAIPEIQDCQTVDELIERYGLGRRTSAVQLAFAEGITLGVFHRSFRNRPSTGGMFD